MNHDKAEPSSEGSNPIERADIAVVEETAYRRDQPVARIANALTWVADQPPLLTATAAIAVWGLLGGNRRLARGGGHMLASMLVATALKTVLKRVVTRTRPELLLKDGVHEVSLDGPDEGPWQSFPSGHTAGAVAVARAVARHWPEAKAPAYAAAAAIGLLQLPRGAHYPTDVLAGAVVGVAAEALAAVAAREVEGWVQDRRVAGPAPLGSAVVVIGVGEGG